MISKFTSKLREFNRINFYTPCNFQKTYGFLMISGGTEVNLFAFIRSEFWKRSVTDTDLFSANGTSESNLNIHFYGLATPSKLGDYQIMHVLIYGSGTKLPVRN